MSLQGQQQIGLEFGAFGFVFVTSSDDVSDKKFALIEAWGGDAQVDLVDHAENGFTGTHTNLAMTVGSRIYGNIQSLNVDSGIVLAYYQLDQRTENE